MSFSDNLRTLRRAKNLSQEELAALLDVSRQAVSKWESGDGYPEVEKLLIIAKELNESLDTLMNSKDMGILEKSDNNTTNNSSVNNGINFCANPGRIMIKSPFEGVITECTKVMRSPKFLFGGKNSPKYALIGQYDEKSSFFGGVLNTWLGWYMTEESILQEIDEIYKAISAGVGSYELKYSVKCKRSFLNIVLDE